MRWLAQIFSMAILTLAAPAGPSPLRAQQAALSPPLRVIIEVPNDEAGRDFVHDKLTPALSQAQQPAAEPAKGDQNAVAPAASVPPPAEGMSNMMATRLQDLRGRALALIEAAPEVPEDIEEATHSFDALKTRFDVLWLIAAAA